jgi:hypothetical protein
MVRGGEMAALIGKGQRVFIAAIFVRAKTVMQVAMTLLFD